MRRTLVATQEMYCRVGAQIQRMRREACISATDLARKVNVTLSHLQKIETGETACSLHVLVSLADEFDCSLDDLVPIAIDSKEFAE